MQKAANDNLVLSRFLSSGRIGEAGQTFEPEGFYQRIALAILKGANESQCAE